MSFRGVVQRKVPCLFVTEVKEEPSAKRERQVAGAARGRAGGRQVVPAAGPGPAGIAGPRVTAPHGGTEMGGRQHTDRVRPARPSCREGDTRVARGFAADLERSAGYRFLWDSPP